MHALGHRLLGPIVIACLAAHSAAQHCENVLVTVKADGTPVDPVGNAVYPAISGDGRVVSYLATYAGITPGISGGVQIYARDLLARTNELVSVGLGGEPGNGSQQLSAVSGDGRYVAFDSFSTNLVTGDTNGTPSLSDGWDVFVRDRVQHVTTRVSVGPGGVQGNGPSTRPTISADGRYVAFESDATNLVAGDTNARLDVFVHDRVTGVTQLVSVDANGVHGNSGSSHASISANGRFVAFSSGASIWAPSGIAAISDVFVKDLQAGTLTFCSLSTSGEYANYHTFGASVSDDGLRVVFPSEASNLVVEDGVPHVSDVFLRDIGAGTTTRISATNANSYVGGDASSFRCSISPDGRWIAYDTLATNLGDGHGAVSSVYLYDTLTHTAELVSRATDGTPADDASTQAALATDGRTVVFRSLGSNLVANDVNGSPDVLAFRRDCLPEPPRTFCSGDGSGTACPCGNTGATGHGCASSIDASGAVLAWSGAPLVSSDTFVLYGTGLSSSTVSYFQGSQRVAGGAGSAFGDGLRCAGGSVIRLGAVFSAGGASQYPNAGDPRISVRGLIPAGGGVSRTYQCWYRNAAAFCTPSGFNLTNGIEVDWGP